MRHNLLDGRTVDDAALTDLAARLFFEAEIAGIGEQELSLSVKALERVGRQAKLRGTNLAH